MASKLIPKDGRLLAVSLLLTILLLIYLLGMHWWFVIPQLDFSEAMQDLREQQQRAHQIVAERPDIEKRLAEVHAYEQSNPAFLAETDFNAASAGLIQRLKQALNENVPDSKRCQLTSQQSSNNAEEELFKRVSIQVRMRCDLELLAAIFYTLENGQPYLFIDQLQLYKQQTWVPPGGKPVANLLDVHFNLSGYLRQQGKPGK